MTTEAFANLVALLHWRGEQQSHQRACTFLVDGETDEQHLTYAELDQQARAIAGELQSRGAAGERVLLLYPPGLDYLAAFFGCLYAGAIAVPVYPPRLNRPDPRLEAVVEDSQATIALTNRAVFSKLEARAALLPASAALHWLPTDELPLDLADHWRMPALTAESLAFLQYTSGSTSTPKGVMVSHGNLMRNERMIEKGFAHEKPVVVSWLPIYHDMGLIGNILQPFYLGSYAIFMSPTAFLQRPIRWLRAISRCQAGTSGAPNFGYELCVSKITPEDREGLDLSHWSIAYCGAEPVRAETIQRFTETFAPYGFRPEAFYPCYGLAEATLFVTGGPKAKKPVVGWFGGAALEKHQVVPAAETEVGARSIVGCGPTWLDQKIKIVDPDSRVECPPDQIGEIWIAGPNVTRGYWNRPDETLESFQAHTADTNAGPFLRTGDLGFLREGELFVTGRIKDLIIIRGHNHYPQDIELTVERSHPALQPGSGAAFAVDVKGEEQLVVVQEVRRDYRRALETEQVLASIRETVSENHQLQLHSIVLIKPLSIPKTSSGKIQRRACRAQYLAGSLEVMETWTASARRQESSDSGYLNGTPKSPDFGPTTESPDSIFHPEAARLEVSQAPIATSANGQARTDELIAWLRQYAETRVNSQLIDERRTIPPYLVLDFGNQGLLGMQAPPHYGGLGLNTSETMRILQQVGAIDQTLALFVGLNNILGIRPIMNYGTPALRDELLPLLATGRELGAFALTEPTAGSNPQAIAAKAIPSAGDGWLLYGTKLWSGSAAWAGVINVFAQQFDRHGQSKGLSGFVVRQGSPGLRQGPEALTMGMRGMIQNTVYLEGVPVGPSHLLGEPGAGMDVAQDAMMYGRLAIGAASVGGMKRCAQLMLRYADRRSISTGRLLNNTVTLARLSNLTAAIAAVESLIVRVAELIDQAENVPVEAYTVCKIAGPEFFWRAADTLVQLLGGRGYIESNIAPQILRDARVLRIFEGPTETLTMFLGSRVLHHPEELRKFLSAHLNAPALFDQLMDLVAQIKARCLGAKSPFTDQTAQRQWAYILTGDLTTYAVLLAAARCRRAAQSPAEQLRQAVEWAQLHFERKSQEALSGSPDEFALSDALALSERITNYTAAIGDLEQTLPGPEYQLDALLRRGSDLAAPTPELRVSDEGRTTKDEGQSSPAPELSSTYTFESIQSWVVHWVAGEFNLKPALVDLHRPFAEYGMDSVKAVEFAFALESWLGNQLELGETIAWNCPNIASLTHYLAGELNLPLPASSAGPAVYHPAPRGQSESAESVVDLDAISDSELADLLAEEIAAVRQRELE